MNGLSASSRSAIVGWPRQADASGASTHNGDVTSGSESNSVQMWALPA